MNRLRPILAHWFTGVFLGWAMLETPVRAETQIDSVPGQKIFAVTYERASDFSGLTWVSGNEFLAVSNRTNGIFPLRIEIDPATGQITEAKFGAPTPLMRTVYSDLEGIAWVPAWQRVYFSSESKDGIVGFDRTGTTISPVKVPSIFQQARKNKSLESLTYGAKAFWTANEDALKCDGEQSAPGRGALIRLQKFDAQFQPVAQYAYRTEPSAFRAKGSGTGVSDLCALPNGELLVLERVVGLGLSAKIFKINAAGATDTSALPSLLVDDLKPVAKTLLFDRFTVATNFEGIALGPDLADGWRSLILISDSGGEATHYLMPLRIRFEGRK